MRLVRQSLSRGGDLPGKYVAFVAQNHLCVAQPLIPQHPGQELGALGRPHRRHHAQFLLSGEIGVEELVARHAEAAAQYVGDPGESAGDRLGPFVEVELGSRQAALHAVSVRPQNEGQIHSYRGASRRAVKADAIAASPDSRRAVYRPRDCLEQRRLAGAVGADDPGEPGTEGQMRVGVLPEVAQREFGEPHARSTGAPASAATSAASR